MYPISLLFVHTQRIKQIIVIVDSSVSEQLECKQTMKKKRQHNSIYILYSTLINCVILLGTLCARTTMQCRTDTKRDERKERAEAQSSQSVMSKQLNFIRNDNGD